MKDGMKKEYTNCEKQYRNRKVGMQEGRKENWKERKKIREKGRKILSNVLDVLEHDLFFHNLLSVKICNRSSIIATPLS